MRQKEKDDFRSPYAQKRREKAVRNGKRVEHSSLPQISDGVHRFIQQEGGNLYGSIEKQAAADMDAVYAELAMRRCVHLDDEEPAAEIARRQLVLGSRIEVECDDGEEACCGK